MTAKLLAVIDPQRCLLIGLSRCFWIGSLAQTSALFSGKTFSLISLALCRLLENANQLGGGGVLSIFVRLGCAVFRISFLPIFSRTGYQKKAIFLELIIKTSQRGKFY